MTDFQTWSRHCQDEPVCQIPTVFPLIEAGSQIQAGSLIEAGGQTSFVLIEAGSLIQAGSLTEAGGLKANIIELIAHTPVALVHCVIRAYCEINRTAVWPTGYLLCSNKYKTKNLGVLNNVMFIGEPGGSNRSRGLLLEEITSQVIFQKHTHRRSALLRPSAGKPTF